MKIPLKRKRREGEEGYSLYIKPDGTRSWRRRTHPGNKGNEQYRKLVELEREWTKSRQGVISPS